MSHDSQDKKFEKGGPTQARSNEEACSQELVELLVSALQRLNESIESLNAIFVEEEPRMPVQNREPLVSHDEQALMRELDELDIQLPQPTIH